MEMKHTPGPWELDPASSAHVIDDDYHVIRAGCGFWAEAKDQRAPGFSIAGHMSAADARVMAAAPELLAALMRCKFDSLNMSLEDLEFCRAAIVKATGGAE